MLRHSIPRLLCAAAGLTTVLSCSAVCYAQSVEEEAVHWAYAAYFGTGRYRLSDGQKTFVVGLKPGWEPREASLDEDGKRVIGLRLRMPVTLGTHSFDTNAPLANLELDNVATMSAVPGVEIEIPMRPRWSLKPIAHLGWGSRLDGSASAWIYWVGLKSQLEFEAGKTEWALVNSLTRVGYTPSKGSSGRALPLLTGFEFRRPLERRKLGGDMVFLNWHLAYTRYLDGLGLDFANSTIPAIDIGNEWELGLGFSKGDRRLKLWRLGWDRVGLAYRFDDTGEFRGLSLVFRSLFDR